MKSKIERALREEELKSERMAIVIQLILITGLFFVYLISPKGFDSSKGIWFEPVKLIFSIYLPILCIRAFHIWKAKHLSVVHYVYLFIDIAAVTVLIFSYHIQYQRPFSLSLHAPTFLYYFIFIVLRCLSYDPLKVISVGAFSTFAWMGMAYYGLLYSNLNRIHSFADFVQADSFILGVEIDKILSLIGVTGICAGAVYRKRRLLEIFSQRNVYVTAMERLVGREAFKSMSEKNADLAPGMGAKRNAATMMVDLRGFSKLSYEMEPERIVSYLGQYHKIVATIVFKHGGSIDKYMGDGILVHFGAVAEQDDFAANALRATEDIYNELNRWRDEVKNEGVLFDFGIAVSIGEVIFGAIGHEDRMEITVIGEAVNLSAKLEKHTKVAKYRVVTTLKTFETARLHGYSPKLGYFSLPNSTVLGIPHSLDLVGIGDPII